MNENGKLELDYAALVKLIPIGLGLSVFASSFMQTTWKELHIYVAFLFIYIVINLDSIVEFGRYNYNVLPKSLKFISLFNGLNLLGLIISISFFSNENLKEISITLIFVNLAVSSILEFFFSLNLRKALKDDLISDKSTIDYDINDTMFYCFWEVNFFLIYISLGFKFIPKYIISADTLPWVGLFVLLIEIFVFNYYKSNNSNNAVSEEHSPTAGGAKATVNDEMHRG